MQRFVEQHEADELRRESQQGLGKPIIGTRFKDYQLVAVGNRVHYGNSGNLYDFLGDYIRQILTAEWGNSEIAKPLSERHPNPQWYDAVCALQRRANIEPGQVRSAPMTGAAAAYYGLAYSLYLLAHNAELQEVLIKRLKNPEQFHGAYYETLVASWFILAGFELSLENSPIAATLTVNSRRSTRPPASATRWRPSPARPTRTTSTSATSWSRRCAKRPRIRAS